MNSTRIALMITAVASLMALTLFAQEKQPGAAPKLVRLQSDGETFAEVRLLKAGKVNLSGQNIERDIVTGKATATDATIEIDVPGGKPITLKASKIELIYNDADAARIAEARSREQKLEQKLALLKEDLKQLLGQYTEEHPKVKQLRGRIDELEAHLAELRSMNR